MQRLYIAFAKWSKIKIRIPRNTQKGLYNWIRNVLRKKIRLKKNTKYTRNETILKIGHLVKVIAFAKWSLNRTFVL